MKRKILLIHGPNFNVLEFRNPVHYGQFSLAELENKVVVYGMLKGFEIDCFQSNAEFEIINEIHKIIISEHDYDALIINAGAFSHYSYAIRDALEILSIKKCEVHLSDIESREVFRQHSVLTETCNFFQSGKGITGYFDAIDYIYSEVKNASR